MADGLRVALIGHGRWGQKLLGTLKTLPGIELRAVCDSRFAGLGPERGLARQGTSLSGAEASGAGPEGVPVTARIFSSVQQMFDAVALDAVVIATPTDTHAELALLAFEQGLHVFVEKPLARNVAQAEAVVRAAYARRRLLMVGHIVHHDAAVSIAYGLLHAGALGQVQMVLAERSNTRTADADAAWWELAPHDIAVCSHVFASEPTGVAVSASGSAARANLGYPSGVACIQVGYGGPRVRRMAWIGTEGALLLGEEPGQGLQLRQARIAELPHDATQRSHAQLWRDLDRSVISSTRVEIPHADALRGELSQFVYCALTGQRPISDAREGLAVVRVLSAGREAMDTGRRIALGSHDVHGVRTRGVADPATTLGAGSVEPDA